MSEIMWYLTFAAIAVSYAAIQLKTRERRFLYYAAAGCVFGFYFDMISFMNGYYAYPDFYAIKLFGLPLFMTICEGFSVSIVIYLYETLGFLAFRK